MFVTTLLVVLSRLSMIRLYVRANGFSMIHLQVLHGSLLYIVVLVVVLDVFDVFVVRHSFVALIIAIVCGCHLARVFRVVFEVCVQPVYRRLCLCLCGVSMTHVSCCVYVEPLLLQLDRCRHLGSMTSSTSPPWTYVTPVRLQPLAHFVDDDRPEEVT